MNLCDKEEECTICLENITTVSIIGTIQTCHHYYHEGCILQWSSHSNSCPTCRKLFYNIEISRKDGREKIERVVSVPDKLLPNDAIDQIPAEYIIPANHFPNYRESSSSTLDTTTERYSSNNKLCSVCSSSDYFSSLAGNLIYCNACPSAFHQNCLGLGPHSNFEEFTWCCPMCDNLQELVIAPSYQSSTTSNRIRSQRINGAIRPRANRIASTRRDTSRLNIDLNGTVFRNSAVIGTDQRFSGIRGRLSSQHSTVSTNPIRYSKLIIHNENDELDDDFLYNNDVNDNEIATRPTFPGGSSQIVNGGVILRKELKEKKKLTKEESQSWDVFDEARKCQSEPDKSEESNYTSTEKTLNSREPRNRRRRKKLSQIPHNNEHIVGTSAELEGNNSNNHAQTRISTLISQLRSPSQAYPKQGRSENNIPASIPRNSHPIANSDSDTQSESDSKLQRKKSCPNVSPKMELTLEQKVQIQKHIRNKLRQYYKPGQLNTNSLPLIISEDTYIDINKTVSRKIYTCILSQFTDGQGKVDSVGLNEYINDEGKLKEIVDKFVEQELSVIRK